MKKILQSILLSLLTLILVVLVVARSELKYKYESPATVPAFQTEPAPSPTPTPEPTPEPTPTPTPEPQPEYFTLSFVGDCTLTSHQMLWEQSPYHYATRMNGDYAYPFSNTINYFDSDDFTFANLECTFSDQVYWMRNPTTYRLSVGGTFFPVKT